ncbi:MAG: putative amidohydrolase, partial [Acidimicrobiia bacterium]|nr:putative amidohydrolase [Acidimicrobiia bacterium]
SAAQLEILDQDGAIATGGLEGAWDIDRRLLEMDREGIAAEVFLQGHQCATSLFFGFQNRPRSADVRMAGVRAYNRWQADMASAANGRLIPIAENTPVADLNLIVRELEWAGEHGFRGTVLPGAISDPANPRVPFYDRYWDPFWAACSEHNLTIVLHVGLGPEQGIVFELFKKRAEVMTGDYDRNAARPDMMKTAAGKEDDLFALNYSPRDVLWQMMVGGVFDRFPNLKYVPTEARADWVPATLAHMDARFEQGDTPLKRRPSEYWESNCFVGASFIHRQEVEDRHAIGVSTLMFGRDYPHPEGTWPNTADWLRAAFAGTPETDARAILGENAVRCYGLDLGALTPIAQRIGLKASDILGTHQVDPRMVEEFDKRGGFLKPAPALVTEALSGLMDSALTGAGASR